MRRKLLIIGSIRQRSLLAAAAARGLDLVVMSARDVERGAVATAPVIALETIDLRLPFSRMVEAMVAVGRRHEVDGIVTIFEHVLAPAAMAAAKLGLPSHSLKAVRNTQNKVGMRSVLEAAGLGQVRFAHCTSPGDVRAFFAAVARAVIVKPLSGTGSEGVARIDDADEIEAAWSLAAESRAFAGVICEEFIDGPEVSVEGYSAGGVYRGIAITDKITNAAFLEVGHAQPSAHPPAVQREVFRYTASVLAALRVTDGWTHTEIKLSTSGPVIIETHTRMGGGAIDVLTLRATGVSIPDVLFDLALGIPPSAQPVDTGEVAAVRFLLNRDAGIVHDVQVPPVPHAIAAWAVDVEVGGEVTARSASGNRLAWAVGTGSNIAAAVQAAESFLSAIRIDIVGKSQWTIPAA